MALGHHQASALVALARVPTEPQPITSDNELEVRFDVNESILPFLVVLFFVVPTTQPIVRHP
jgi:hypothetical protein